MKYRQAVGVLSEGEGIVSLVQCEACKYYAGLVESTILCEFEGDVIWMSILS